MLVISSTLEDKISYAHAKQPFDILYITNDKVAIKICRKNERICGDTSVPIDAADMRTVKKIQIFPHYRVDPHNFGKGMELARETSVLAKKTY